MVCLIAPTMANNNNEVQSAVTDVKQERLNSTTEIISEEDEDELKLRRIVGGSIIDKPPLFSPDAEWLLTVAQNLIHIYSTTTGERIRSLEGSSENIIGFCSEIENPDYLIGCSRTGEILRWKLESAKLEDRIKLTRFKNCEINSFNLIDISPQSPCALITYKENNNPNFLWCIADIKNGKLLNTSITFDFKDQPVIVNAENKYFHYFTIAQGNIISVVNYKTMRTKRCYNASRVPITCLEVHPSEEMFATGDAQGRIYLWREIWKARYPVTTLYHWHHTSITSLRFTEIGSGFYSSGYESVLVKWNIHRPDLKEFLPRTPAPIIHIAVSPMNEKVAICMADNGIQILGAQNQPKCTLQNSTYVYDDRTGLEKFPIGVKLNPKNNNLVLNGRIGCLQFFSTYSKRLLYNMEIVSRNTLSFESNKILYNVRVTRAAFNVDWMVTGEVFDDQEHTIESVLKFWKYNKTNQSYKLFTYIQNPHENGFEAIEFSSNVDSENILCCTAGKEGLIKIWALEDSENIKRGKVWYCVAKRSYKNLAVQTINFSQDGSLLAAGFANNLCIYKSDNLKLKAVLTAPCGIDGTLQTIEINVPKEDLNGSKTLKKEHSELTSKRRKIISLFQSFIENNEENFLSNLKNTPKAETLTEEENHKEDEIKAVRNMTTRQKEQLFKKVLSNSKLNFFLKVLVYQKSGIFSKSTYDMKAKLRKYINSTLITSKQTERRLHSLVNLLSDRERFKAKYRLYKYEKRRPYSSSTDRELILLMDLLNLNSKESPEAKSQQATHNGFVGNDTKHENLAANLRENSETKLNSLQDVSHVKHVAFGTGEFAHLIVSCTEQRVLIWNILTLRLESVLKLSTDYMTVDPITSVFAIFSKFNELFIFLPNVPMPIYRRANLPNIKGACWVPKQYPKSQSLNIDWQSTSTLYFLSEAQELMCLASDDSYEEERTTVTFINEPQEEPNYSTFGAFAVKQVKAINENNRIQNSRIISKIGIPGKSSVKELTGMAAHTMAPANLLCKSFIKSFLEINNEHDMKNDQERKNQIRKTNLDDLRLHENFNREDDNDDDYLDSEILNKIRKNTDLREKLENQKRRSSANTVNALKDKTTTQSEEEEKKLQRLLKGKLKIEF